jgi:glycosyltransferase involved in cell wall biosynthesis
VTKTVPKVSIGLPVFNGQNYIAEAIESLLDQSFRNFELIISDNSSNDATASICTEYARHDRRVRYIRNAENIGAAPNYNQVFTLARGIYFKWAAHDDMCRRGFLQRCVAALDGEPRAVLAYPLTATIDYRGEIIKQWSARPALGAMQPSTRFREALREVETHPIWGLMRVDALRRTPLFGSYPAHDLPLLAELSLLGRFIEIPEILFLQREHRQRSVRVYDFRNPHRAVVWYDPRRAGKLIFPRWRILKEYLAAIRRTPISTLERLHCLALMPRWMRDNVDKLSGDLVRATERLPAIGRFTARIYDWIWNTMDRRHWRRAAAEIRQSTASEDIVLLADNCWFGYESLIGRRTFPFLEKDGQFFGVPANDGVAIEELERMRRVGATYVAFAWPALWWLNHYTELHRHLRSQYRPVFENKRLVVFDLHSTEWNHDRRAGQRRALPVSPVRSKPQADVLHPDSTGYRRCHRNQ